MPKAPEKKVASEQKRLENERQLFLDDMFDDIYLRRRRVYSVNFFRGVFFGLGTFLGGTVVVAFLVWFLSSFIDWPMVDKIIEALQR